MNSQISSHIEQLLTQATHKPLIVGISGPQGSGKSYLVTHLLDHFHTTQPNLKVAGFLIDDFYLPHDKQAEVTANAKNEGNWVLQGRGLPGTHDVELLQEVLEKLRAKQPVAVPKYDKSAFNGEGDRLPQSEWEKFEGAVDLVLLEGWFTGFRALEPGTFTTAYFTNWPSSLVQKHKYYHLQEVNERLEEFHLVWDSFDYFVFFDTDSTDNVYAWRQEQEDELIAKKGTGMTKEQVRAFVDRYMPMYVLYYWRLCREGTAKKGKNLKVRIDENRDVLSIEVV